MCRRFNTEVFMETIGRFLGSVTQEVTQTKGKMLHFLETISILNPLIAFKHSKKDIVYIGVA